MEPEVENNKNIFAEFQKQYQNAGYSVIPGKYGSKMPAIKNWSEYCYRMPTTDEVMSWIRNFDQTNLDVALGEASGIVALDIDSTDQRILDVIMPMLPESPVVKKGSKGETRFFRYAKETTESLKFNGEMVVEILSNGKKTTLPPSRHPNGLDYQWTTEQTLLTVNKNDLPLLPPALFAHLGSVLKTTFPDMVQDTYGKIISGRNDELSSLCGNLIQQGLPIGEAVSILIQKDGELNDPPLFTDQNEFRHTEPVTNALMFYANHLNTINNKHYRDSKEYEIPVMPKAKDTDSGKPMGAEPKRSTRNLNDIMSLAPTVLKNLHTTLLNNSWVKQPDLSLGACLSLMSVLISRKVVFQGLSPNLYVLNISPSGSGKDKPQSFIKEVLIDMRADSLLGAGDYVSDASLMDGLSNKPVRLDIMDEAGGILRNVNSSKSDYGGKMADILAELYTSSHTKYLGRQTAEGNKGTCYRPNVNILASTTPTGFSEGVSRKSIEKGLMGRFLVFMGDPGAQAERLKEFPKLPGFVNEQLEFWYSLRLQDYFVNNKYTQGVVEIDMGGIPQLYAELRATKAAEDRLDEIFIALDSLRRDTEATDPKLPIIARLYQQMTKLVMISAACRTIQDIPVIQKEDVEFGYALIMYYFDTIGEVVDKYVFENKTQMNSQKILNLISDEGGSIILKDLFKKARFLNKRERDNIIEDLLSSGLIDREMETINGQPEIVVRRIG
jgi:hypothetical protein